MIRFLDTNEINELINFPQDQVWEREDSGCKYDYTFIHNDKISKKLIKIFENIQKLTIDCTPVFRLLRLKPGDSLPTHNFDYSNIPDNPYRNVKFVITLFLNNNYKGGVYYYNNKPLVTNPGNGVIHNLTTKGKVEKVESGEMYLLFFQIDKVKNNSII